MGAKKKPPEIRLKHWKVALTEAEYAACCEAAARDGRTFASWARWHLRIAAGVSQKEGKK